VSAKNRQTGQKVAIKLIDNIKKSIYSLRKVFREICIMRKLTNMNKNIFTIKLVEIVLPAIIE